MKRLGFVPFRPIARLAQVEKTLRRLQTIEDFGGLEGASCAILGGFLSALCKARWADARHRGQHLPGAFPPGVEGRLSCGAIAG